MSEIRDPLGSSEINGYEVLQRVRRARDWARSEADRLSGGAGPMPPQLSGAEQGAWGTRTLAAVVEEAAYRVIVNVLDEILDPGSRTVL